MITNNQVPVELKTPATLLEQQIFAKYQNFTGIPDFGWTQGYASADLLIKGLEVAGQNPTRASFISNLRQVTSYNVENLSYTTANFSDENPPPTQCAFYVKLVGKQFIVQNNDKVICGTLLPSS
jgi:Periplasmic binding protein